MKSFKRKYIKSGMYTKENIVKRKMDRIFDKTKKLYDNEEKTWYEKIKNLYKPMDEIKKDFSSNLNSGKRNI